MHFRAGDFEAAFKIWRPLAEDGDARAQFWVGELYIEGKGVAKNLAHARKWIEAAAQQGYTKTEHRMGEIYRFGIGVTANADTSYDWYLRAVKKKYAPADLGISELVLFHFAQTEKTLQLAHEILQYPAEKGLARAQYLYALLFYTGKGGANDPALARDWFTKAAEQEHAKSQISLAELMRLGHGGPVDYDGSAKWLLGAVASGDFDAWAHMGQLCPELKPQKQYDHMFAKLWFLSGAKNGSKLAQSIVDNWGLETKQLVEVLLKRHKKNRLDIEADSYTPSRGMLPRN